MRATVFADRLDPSEVERWLGVFEGRTQAPGLRGYDFRSGERVTWFGEGPHLVRVSWDQVRATPGNIFDWSEIEAMARYMRAGGTGFHAPPARVEHPVDPEWVGDTQQAARRNELFDTDGMTRPLTTGDAELDEYLRDRDDLQRTLKRMQEKAPRDPDTREAKAQMKALEKRVAAAVRAKKGDLGTLIFQLRNGNHRAAAAQIVGEPFLWVHVLNPEDLP